jgi:hypothetical protein
MPTLILAITFVLAGLLVVRFLKNASSGGKH